MIMWVNWVIFGAGNGLLRIWQQAITVINTDLLWIYTYEHILMLFEKEIRDLLPKEWILNHFCKNRPIHSGNV